MASIRRNSLATNRRRQPPPSLPTDIIFYQIFPRLPVKSLHRFRCVSTSCRRLPSDPTFLSAVRRLSRRRYFISFSTATHKYSWQVALYTLDPSSSSGPAISDITPREQCTYAKMLNGLMLTVTGKHIFDVVSNAATNENFYFPSFREPSKTDRMFFYFCHNPATDAYKVLRTTAVNAYRSNKNDTTAMKYSVLTVGKHQQWKDFVLPELYQLGKSRTACIDGTLYFTRFTRTGGDDIIHVIGAFNVERECFYAVKYPDGLSPSRYNQCHLVDLKGALAVIDIKESYEMELWMKVGDNTWTECRRIEFDPMMSRNLLRYYSLSGNVDGEIVVGSGSSGNEYWIFVYNMEKGEWRRVEVEGVGEGVEMLGNFGVEEYVESPLPLKEMLDRWKVHWNPLIIEGRKVVDAHA